MATTAVSYFKRYKMEADLRDLPPPSLPPGFHWLPWSDEQLTAHAEVLYESFHQEIDAVVFPSLGNPDGCVTLMTVVSRRLNFLAEATWLAVGPAGPCGAIQGLHERGVARSRTSASLRRGVAAESARPWCCRRCTAFAGRAWRGLLEVTAQNEIAQRLYRRLGFRRTRTLYKAVPETMNDER